MGKALQKAIQSLSREFTSKISLQAVDGQPFDSMLLALSPLYRKSRSLFLSQGGVLKSALISSPRTLSSSSLLTNTLEYSPIEKELLWSATDPREKRNFSHLLTLRSYISNLFHEQNHRILWSFLPYPSSAEGLSKVKANTQLRNYLNFVESLVVILDMALGDELGAKKAQQFHRAGVIYNPGSEIKLELRQKRQYRNYLQASLLATYLCLEHYDINRIPDVVSAQFPGFEAFAFRAASRSVQLDRKFVLETNPIWQRRNKAKIQGFLLNSEKNSCFPLRVASKQKFSEIPSLVFSTDPLENRVQYLWAEKWFDHLGL